LPSPKFLQLIQNLVIELTGLPLKGGFIERFGKGFVEFYGNGGKFLEYSKYSNFNKWEKMS
jgi:hypothetical protein